MSRTATARQLHENDAEMSTVDEHEDVRRSIDEHDSFVERVLRVDGHSAHVALDLRREEDTAHPRLTLEITGSHLSSPGGISRGVALTITSREALGAISDALRCLANRAEASGFLSGLPLEISPDEKPNWPRASDDANAEPLADDDDLAAAKEAMKEAISADAPPSHKDGRLVVAGLRMIERVTPRGSLEPRGPVGRAAVELHRRQLDDAFAAERAELTRRLFTENARYLELALVAREGQGAWLAQLDETKRAHHGADEEDVRGAVVPTLTQIQERYDDRLIDSGVVPESDGALYLLADMEGPVSLPQPGVTVRAMGAGHACIDLALGHRVFPRVGGDFGAEMRIIVNDDLTMQALALDFAERLYQVYGTHLYAEDSDAK